MKKLLMGLGLVLFSCQAAAMPVTEAGIGFLDTAAFTRSVGAYTNNTATPGPEPVGDLSGATWVMSGDTTATLDLTFSKAFDVSGVDLTLLLVGNSFTHSGTITLTGGTSSFSDVFSIDSTGDTSNGYTGWNTVTGAGVPSIAPTVQALYALTIPLRGAGDFTGVTLDISGYSAVPSMVGVTTAVVPVPAAVWLFGSGLLGLVGVARRKK